MSWIWSHWVEKDNSTASENEFMQLTESSEQLLDILVRQDEPYSHRFGVSLIGGRDLNGIEPKLVRQIVSQFSRGLDSPVGIVILDIGDTPESYVFVPKEPSPDVAALMRRWGILDRRYRTRDYRQLSAGTLERYFAPDVAG